MSFSPVESGRQARWFEDYRAWFERTTHPIILDSSKMTFVVEEIRVPEHLPFCSHEPYKLDLLQSFVTQRSLGEMGGNGMNARHRHTQRFLAANWNLVYPLLRSVNWPENYFYNKPWIVNEVEFGGNRNVFGAVPDSVAVGPDGTVWVVQVSSRHRVKQLEASFEIIRKQFSGILPFGLTIKHKPPKEGLDLEEMGIDPGKRQIYVTAEVHLPNWQ